MRYHPICELPLLSLLLLFTLSSSRDLHAQGSNGLEGDERSKTEWSVQGDPLGRKAFVKNEGQFAYEALPEGTEVQYGTDIGDRVLFTEQGLFFRVNAQDGKGLEELEEAMESGEDLDSPDPRYVRMKWLGASENRKLIAEDPKSGYYTYGDLPGERAKGFGRLIYKDLYPGIDVIYKMPEGKRGLKYRIVAEPGADLEQVRMKYQLPEDSLELSKEGHLRAWTKYGAITDHAPKNSIMGGKEVDVDYGLEGNTVSFKLGKERNPNEKVVIDPWTTTPSTLNISGTGTLIYDVDEDDAGNVYVSGGGGPYKTAKLSSSGTVLWTYTWPSGWGSSSGTNFYYSELAVLPNSGSVYIGEGFNGLGGVKVMKINTNGTFVDSSSLFTGTQEIWKMVYNRCTGQLIGYGGGTSGSNNNLQILSDTNIATATATTKNFNNNSSASCCNDIADVVMDGSGDFYALISTLDPTNPSHDEKLEKGLAPNYNTLGFSVNSGYQMEEGAPYSQIPVIGDYTTDGKGTVRENMLALTNDYLYSYDGRTLKAWDKGTGNLLDSVIVDLSYDGNTTNSHEGIDVDPCNNVYVGGNSEVHIYQFDGSTFTANGSISNNISGQVYDVKLEWTPKRLIVGGYGFVSAVDPLACSDTLNPHLSVTQPSCDSGNNGAISVDSVSGVPGPYSYQWSTGDTTSSISGLAPGSYDLTVLEQSCNNPQSFDTTITLLASGSLSIDSVILDQPTCDSPCAGSIDVEYSGATPPLQFSIDSGNSFQSDSLFTSVCAGTYDVVVEDSACTAYQQVQLNSAQGFDFSIADTSISCYGACDGVIDISVSGGSPPFQFSVDSGASFQSDSTFTGLCANSFELLIEDSSGCMGDTTILLSQPDSLKLTVDSLENVSCEASNDGYVAVGATGGTTPYDFQWGANAGNQTGPVLDSLAPGTYQCVVTDSNGCTDSLSVTIDGYPALDLSSSSDTVLCNSDSVTLSASATGGNPPYEYFWNGSSGAGSDTSISPSSTTDYTVAVEDSSGCLIGPDTITVSVIPPLSVDASADVSVCKGDSALLTADASGGNGNYTYSWDNGANGDSVAVSPDSTNSYTVTVTGDCPASSAEDSVTVTVDPLPDPVLSADTLSGCVPLEVDLSNNTDSALTGDCLWYLEDTDTLGGCNGPTVAFDTPGCHDITLSVTSPEGCSNDTTYQDHICTYPIPEADFMFEPHDASVLNPTVDFMNQSQGATQYRWDFAGLDSSSETDPTYTFPKEKKGSYPVCLEAISDHGCRDTICKDVIIEGEFLLYVPNAFTPDGDGINDGFYPVIQGHDPSSYEFTIYDRWGERIFKSTDPQERWKGRVKGTSTLATPDVYVWKLQVRSKISGSYKTFTGHVTLVR